MPRRLARLLLLATLLHTWLAVEQARAQVGVVLHNVNLRTDPSTDSTAIRLLTKGTRVQLVESERALGFYAVETLDGKAGWVWARNIRIDSEPPPSAPGGTTSGKTFPRPPCTPFGDAPAGSPDDSTDHLKARTRAVTTQTIDKSVTLTKMLAPGYDLDRFNQSHAAVIEGVVLKVKSGGKETVNCQGTPDTYDSHIELVARVGVTSHNSVVVAEVTPQWRKLAVKKGRVWSTDTLKARLVGQRVRITGWLLKDWRHAAVAAHTGKPTTTMERATVWEVHPITRIQVLVSGKWKDI